MKTDGNSYFDQNLGIGTTTPKEKLQIGDQTTLFDYATHKTVLGQNTWDDGGTWKRINQSYDSWQLQMDSHDTTPNFSIYYSDKESQDAITSWSSRFTIDKDGYVGIGTPSPVEELHICKAQDAPTAIQLDNSNTGSSAGSRIYFQESSSKIFYMYRLNSDDAFYFKSYDGTTYRDIMKLCETGNVGIGDAAPSHRLSVTGDVCASACMIATEFHGDGSNLTNLPATGGMTEAGAATFVCPTGACANFCSTISCAATCMETPFVCTTNVGVGNTESGTDAFVAGISSQATGCESTAVGFKACATDENATAVGWWTIATDSGATAIGTNSCAINTASTAVGYASRATGSLSQAFGYTAKACGNSGNTAIGSGSCAIGTYNSTASGYRACALATNAFASGNFVKATVACTFGVGLCSCSTAVYASAVGIKSCATGIGASAFGYYASSRITSTANIGGAVITKKDSGETTCGDFLQFSGVETMLMTKEIDLKTTACHTITVPAGATFWINEMGVISTCVTSLTTQATVSIGCDDTNTDTLMDNLQTTALTVAKKRERYLPATPEDGLQTITVEIATAAAATTACGRFYFKGMLVEDE